MDIKKAFQTYYVSALKRYADFKGRTSRRGYWMFVLINILISWAVVALDNIIGTEEVGRLTFFGLYNGMFNNFYGLIMLVPGLAIAVRRLHDVGKDGKFFFWIFLPVVGWMMLLVELIKVGDPVENAYGSVPKEDDEWQPTGHPYTPNQESGAGSSSFAETTEDRQKPEFRSQNSEDGAQKPEAGTSFDIVAIRKEVEKKLAEQPAPVKPVKKKKPKKSWLIDRGAVDFTYHQNEKRKT